MTVSGFDLVRDYLPYNILQTLTRVRDISVYYIHHRNGKVQLN